jgi:hypothetical protein
VGALGDGSPVHRPQGKRWWKESVSAAVRADWTGCDGVCCTWSEIGVRGCRRSILLPWTMQQWLQRSAVQQVPGYKR